MHSNTRDYIQLNPDHTREPTIRLTYNAQRSKPLSGEFVLYISSTHRQTISHQAAYGLVYRKNIGSEVKSQARKLRASIQLSCAATLAESQVSGYQHQQFLKRTFENFWHFRITFKICSPPVLVIILSNPAALLTLWSNLVNIIAKQKKKPSGLDISLDGALYKFCQSLYFLG